MNPISITASYNKNEHSSEMKPTITNTVSITNSIGDKTITEDIIDSSPVNPLIKLPPKSSLKVGSGIDEDKRTAFEKRLLGIYTYVLSTNDKVLLNNIIDITGDIILAKADLIELIKIITGADDVSIVTGDRSVKMSCLNSKKIPLWVPVSKIIVNSQDFYVGYNRIHTMFAEYKITLEKVI